MFQRKNTIPVKVGNIIIGGNYPIIIQSMTNTDTADVDNTVKQIIELFKSGSDLVRITVDRDESAKAVPYIRDKIIKLGFDIPLIGDFHYIGHKLLAKYPACGEALSKYRINPGNVGFKKRRDAQFSFIIETAIKNDKPIRIGVNMGSLDQDLLNELINKNNLSKKPIANHKVIRETMVQSALNSAKYAEKIGLKSNKIIISGKVSTVKEMIAVYEMISNRCNYALHLGLTEAGMGSKGIVNSSIALAFLLKKGIGDTIRVSITPSPGSKRTDEVIIAQEILQSLGIRLFSPMITSCPGCGRTANSTFQLLAENIKNYIYNKSPIWRNKYIGFENLTLAVMGCIVNGPGESKNANIGISLPGIGEDPIAPVFIDGKKILILREKKLENLIKKFKNIIKKYVDLNYQKK